MNRSILVLVAAALASPAFAMDYDIGPLHIAQPWARATPPGAQTGGGYMTVTNNGTEPDRLVGGTSPVAGRVEVHEMQVENGIMKMRPLPDGLEIKPGETVTLRPGGHHVMFEQLREPLRQGRSIPATLDFAKAGRVNVEFAVEAVGARAPAAHQGTAPGAAMPGGQTAPTGHAMPSGGSMPPMPGMSPEKRP